MRRELNYLLIALITAASLTPIAQPIAATEKTKVPDSVSVLVTAIPDSVTLKGKVVYVDFWASWCAPCAKSFPWMQELYANQRTEGFELIAICVDKEHDAAVEFLETHPATFPIVFDSTGNLAKQYGLKAMPSSFLYGRDGKLVESFQGFRDGEADSVESRISALLKMEKSE